MMYTLDDLFSKLPSERLVVPDKNPNRPAVFAARWPKASVASHGEFVRITEMYDSAMQGFVQGMTPVELAEYFVPHDEYDWSTPPLEIASIRAEDSVEWMKRNLPNAHVPWLQPGDHTEIIDEHEGEFGDLIAFGVAGYLYVFVADEL